MAALRSLKDMGWHFRRGAEKRTRDWVKSMPFRTMSAQAMYLAVKAATNTERLNRYD